MPKTIQKLKKKHKEFYSLHPNLSYVDYADSKQLDRNSTNIGYKSTLETLKSAGNRECRKQAIDQSRLFDTRKDPNSKFGKEYKLYWDLRESKERETTASRVSQQLQQMATDNTISLAQTAWGSIQTQTQIALGTNRPHTNTSTTFSNHAESSENSTTISSSCPVDSRDNDKVFQDYFHDINEAIDYSLNGVIDWTIPAAREMAINRFPASIITIIQDLCQFKEYEYTPECKSLVSRLTGEEKSIMAWRKELLKPHEFTDKAFDPLDNQDWDYVKFMTEHFLRLIEAPTNPLMSKLGERTAVSYTIQPIFNHLILPYAHLFSTKWIEVSNDYTGSVKLDGLGISNSSKEILLIIEFAGGNISSSTAKFDSDIKKIYDNALKTIKRSGRDKIFTVLYFNNLIYYEVLIKLQNQYVRFNYIISKCPLNSPELRKFVKDTKVMFAWVRDLAAFARTMD